MVEYVLIVILATGTYMGGVDTSQQSATFASREACETVRNSIRRVIATAPGVRFLAADCYPKSKEPM